MIVSISQLVLYNKAIMSVIRLRVFIVTSFISSTRLIVSPKTRDSEQNSIQ